MPGVEAWNVRRGSRPSKSLLKAICSPDHRRRATRCRARCQSSEPRRPRLPCRRRRASARTGPRRGGCQEARDRSVRFGVTATGSPSQRRTVQQRAVLEPGHTRPNRRLPGCGRGRDDRGGAAPAVGRSEKPVGRHGGLSASWFLTLPQARLNGSKPPCARPVQSNFEPQTIGGGAKRRVGEDLVAHERRALSGGTSAAPPRGSRPRRGPDRRRSAPRPRDPPCGPRPPRPKRPARRSGPRGSTSERSVRRGGAIPRHRRPRRDAGPAGLAPSPGRYTRRRSIRRAGSPARSPPGPVGPHW